MKLKQFCDRLFHLPFPLRLVAFLLALAVAWLPVVGLASLWLDDANTISIVVMSVLFIEFFVLLNGWGRWVYRQPWLIQRYGLVLTRRNGKDLLQGLVLGGVSLCCLFIVQGLLGWVVWQPVPPGIFRIALEGLLIALGVGLGEELIFRGWLLDELERDYLPTVALWASSLAFAVLHFIKPLSEMVRTAPQFPGLVVLGVALVLGKRSHQRRLGFPIGLHAGLVWSYYMINVGGLIEYANRVPEWVTGIDRNPLAGLLGLLFLGAIALFLWRQQPKAV